MKTKIFVYDKNSQNHNPLKEALKTKFSIKFFASEDKILSAIESKLYTDLILVNDSSLEDKNTLINLVSAVDRSKVSFCVMSDSGSEQKRIQAFKLGVDDYIDTKVSDEELIVRLINKAGKLKFIRNSAVKFGNLLINFEEQASYLEGVKVPLTPLEFKILSLLVKKPAMVHTKNDISEFLWGELAYQKQHSLDTHICNLRKKIFQFNYRVKALKGRGVTLTKRELQLDA